MKISTRLSVLVLAGALATGAAHAQSANPDQNTLGEAAATAQSQQTDPIGSGAVLEWVGKPLAAEDGTKVGTVSQVMTNERGAVMEVRATISALFGLFSREVSIPAARILLEQDGVLIAEMSVDEIKTSPTVRG